MATALDNLAKHLDCAICFERLKEPKILKCQHTYCRGCLEKLVEKSGQQAYVHCPECREKTEIPLRGVKDLPPNFLINKLLSELGKQSTATPVCVNHEEVIKLYCESCDQLICRDCTIIDHREHKYKFVKDVYPAQKKKIEEVVAQSQKKILDLETSLKTIDNQEGRAEINCKEVSSKVDDVINKQIKLLNEKRENLKAELQELARTQKQHRDRQKKPLESSLNRIKQSVEFAGQAIRKGNEVEVLLSKNQIIKELEADVGVTDTTTRPRGMILYDLKIDSPHDGKVLGIIPKIIEYDEEYTLQVRRRSCWWYKVLTFGAEPNSYPCEKRIFDICSKSKHVSVGPVNRRGVTVKIKKAASNDVESLDVMKMGNGSFSFSYFPTLWGIYEIEIMINGRFVKGSPFKWRVESQKPEHDILVSSG